MNIVTLLNMVFGIQPVHKKSIYTFLYIFGSSKNHFLISFWWKHMVFLVSHE